MKKTIVFLLIVSSLSSYSITWMPYGPQGIHANNVAFSIAHYYDVICADSGIYINDGPSYTWVKYSYSLPVYEAIALDTANILLVMGNGSYSDGIYKFNFISHSFHMLEYCYMPTFIKQDPVTNTYYAGTRYNGLWKSPDGISWDTVGFFTGRGCQAMDFFGNHLVITQENNVAATYYSSDAGSTWSTSISAIPIHDLAFMANGKLYGVFAGFSNSSGLYSSSDFGQHWSLETYSENINTVTQDVTGNVFTGWHSSVSQNTGIGVYYPATQSFTLLNQNLPNLNIQKLKPNPFMNSIAMFACTDSGVYFCNDYYMVLNVISLQALSIQVFPNPAQSIIKIVIPQSFTEIDYDAALYTTSGKLIFRQKLRKGINELETDFSAGIYYIQVSSEKGEISKNKICITGK